MKKVWKNILNDYPDLDVKDFDYDINSEEVKQYNPGKVLPIVIFLDNDNNELERLIGEQKEATLRDYIDKYK